ncbi:MAG TPA: TonB-dependent receptor [Balneolaceae bacterium]
MLRKLLSTVLFMAFFVPAAALAQTGSIEGTVTDAETGETVPGANVFLVENNRGAATDIDGNYSISNVEPGTYTLRVTFVGYQTYTDQVVIEANETLDYDVQLQIGAVGLDEVVVTGYGTTTKRELTGSIASIDAGEIEDVPVQNVESLLQGRAAGVTVTAVSGNPGGGFSVDIRGAGSINAGAQPLYIVDGVPISFSPTSGVASTTPLNAINPSDILSIEVLKDAASAAIYGAQAASGVVIITTKSGQASGPTQITVSAETGVTMASEMPDYLSTQQYLDYMGEIYAYNTGASVEEGRQVYQDYFIGVFDTPGRDGEELANTDWQDFIYQQGVSRSYNVAVSGGNDKTTFYLSGALENVDGHIFNSSYDDVGLRANLDHKVNEDFNIGLNLNLSNFNQFGICQDGNWVNCPTSQAMFEPPMTFPYYNDGEYGASVLGPVAWNPAVIKEEVERNVTVVSVISNLDLNYRINDWLQLNGTLGIDYRDSQDERWETPIASPATGGSLAYTYRNIKNYIGNLRLNGARTFDEVHNVSGFVGAEYRRNYYSLQYVQGQGFPGSFFKVLDAASTPTGASGSNTEYRLGSYFGNVKYNYDDKYFISVVARYDGHSRFGTETRWGLFPSVSGAWRITEEDFFNVGFISELKLRAGYGTTGNAGGNSLGNFIARGLYSAVGSYNGATALTPTQLANVNLGWEEAQEINIGLDFGLMDGRISGSVDVYQKDNENLLLGRELPVESGFGSITENVGTVRNQGIEFAINTINVNTPDFLWSTRFNTAFMSNEILDLGEDEFLNEDATFSELGVGQKIGIIQVPRWAGVNPADGRPMWYDAEGNLTYTPNGVDDAIIYKDGLAEVVGGFGNTLRYKGLSLDIFFQFSFGQWAFGNTDYYFNRTPDFLMNLSTIVLDGWRQPGDITYFPRPAFGTGYTETGNYRVTLGTQSIYNASYIRLKNVTLSYNLPASITDKLNLGGVRFFATGLNLHTWTAWPYYDPEVAFDEDDIYKNLVAASYPVGMRINAGIEIQF